MTYVDERIVELRFDNKQFEKETAQSMSTLDKLKEKLSFKNASSGAEQLQKAVANINVNPIIQGIDTIETKMSALSTAGKRIVENIVDWAMSGISKIVNKLNVVNQIVTGGKTRALNIEQAKFQLEGLGIAWADIQEDINYGVQDTAYGLDVAAKVASQLVASQVELGDEMKHALLGISGVAAMTNSTYEDIGRIYTTVAGNGRLMGEQLLQLSSRGINAAAQLGKALGVTEAEVRDMVSKGKISFKMFSDAMFEAFGEHAKSANKTFQGALSNTKAALSRLGADVAAQGFNSIRDILNDIIPKLKEFKTRIAPLEESIIKMVEAVGKLVQAFVKSLDIEGIVDKIAPKIQKVTDAITEYIEAYLMIFGGKTKGNTTAFLAEQKGLARLEDSAEGATEALVDLSKITDEEIQMANDIWYKKMYGTGEERKRQLGEHYKMVQAYIDEMISLGWDQDKMQEKLTESAKEQAEAEKDLTKVAHKQQTVRKLINILGNLKRIAGNVFTSVKNVLSVMFDAFKNVFGGGEVSNGVKSFTGSLADISDKLVITEKRAQKLKPVFEVIFGLFKLLGKVVVTAAKAASALIDVLGKFIRKVKDSAIVKALVDAISKAFTSLKNAVVGVYEKLKESGVWDKLVSILQTVAHFIGTVLIGAFNVLSEVGATVIDALANGFGWVVEKVDAIIQSIKDGDSPIQKFKDFFTENVLEGSWLTKLKDLLADIFGTGGDVFGRAFTMGSDFINGLIQGIKNLSLEDVEMVAKIIAILGTTIAGIKWLFSLAKMNNAVAEMTGSLSVLLEGINKTIKKYGKRADMQSFKIFATSVAIIVGSIVGLMAAIAALQYLGFDAKGITIMASTIVGIMTVIVGVILVLNTLFQKVAMNNQGTYFNFFAKTKIPALALTLFSVAMLIGSLIKGLILVYDTITDENFKIGNFIAAVLIVGSLLAGVVALSVIGIKLSKAISGFGGFALTIAAVGVLIWSLVKSIKSLSKILDDDNTGAIAEAYEIVSKLLWQVIAFAWGVLIIQNFRKNEFVNKTNPFKGLFGVFISLAALIRLALIPLLDALVKASKEGDAGVDAIGYFEEILGMIQRFVLILSIAALVLSKNYNFGRNAFTSGNSPILSVALMIAAFATVMYTLMGVFDGLKDVDNEKLNTFKKILIWMEGFIAIMAVLAGVAGFVSGETISIALLGVAAIIASLGIALAGAGVGFLLFERGIRELITTLPDMLDSLLEFFSLIKGKDKEIFEGVRDTVKIFFNAITASIVGWSEAMMLQVPIIVENLFNALIVSLYAIGDKFYEQGPELVDAADRAASGFLYFLALVVQKIREKGKQFFKDVGYQIGGLLVENMNPAAKYLIFGLDDYDWDQAYQEPEWYAEKFREEGTKTAYTAYGAYRDAYEREKARLAKEESSDLFDFSSIIDTDALSSKFGGMLSEVFGKSFDDVDVDKYLADFKDKVGISVENMNFQDIFTAWSTQDASNLIGVDLDDINGLFGQVLDGQEGNIDEMMANIENFDFESSEYMREWTTNIGAYGGEGMDHLTEATKAKKAEAIAACQEVADAMVEKLRSYEPKFYVTGKFLHDGFNAGMADEEATRTTYSNVADMVLSAKRKLEETAQIHSPSKMFMKLGRYVTMGFAEGILQLSSYAEEATEDVGNDAMDSLRSIISRIYDSTMEGLDTNPRITPVLDFSELEKGFGQVSDMFARNNTYGLAVGAGNGFNRSLAMKNSETIQNGYDDSNVVQSIDSLRNEMSEMRAAFSTMGIYLDKKTLVGGIAEPMNNALNVMSVRAERGIN